MDETLQGGRFVLAGTLGEGSQGRTFDAYDRRDGHAVAIKRFDVRGAHNWKDAELAEREARVLQSLVHPKLPRYIDHFEEQGALYLVMEKIEGETLATLRARGVTLGAEELLRFLEDASEVLDYLHRRPVPVIHRDLKPGNVLRRSDGSFAFVDFGAVRDKLRPEGGSTIVGTFGYMAPEQFQGRALPASDVYAVGATALALLTGREPETLPHRGLSIDVRASIEGQVDARLVDLLQRMLEPDPDRRPTRIRPLLDELRRPVDDRRDRADRHARKHERAAQRVEQGAREYERRAAEYEHRAARGDVGAQAWRRGAESMRAGSEAWRAAQIQVDDAWTREVDRRAARRARRAERRAERRQHARRPPWPIVLLFAVGLSVGIVAVTLATRVWVPAILLILSRFFARQALVRAAGSVAAGGRVATANMAAIRRWLIFGSDGTQEPMADASPREEPSVSRVRVEEAASHDPSAQADADGAEAEEIARDTRSAPRAKG